MHELVYHNKNLNTYKLAPNVRETLDFLADEIAESNLVNDLKRAISACECLEEERAAVITLLRERLLSKSRP